MSSPPNPLRVSQIHATQSSTSTLSPPENRTLSPPVEYFEQCRRSHGAGISPGNSHSPGSSIAKTPVGDRLTPPQFTSGLGPATSYFAALSRQDSNYFTRRSSDPSTGQTQATSPAERLSYRTCVSHNRSSDSFNSSERAHSNCSYSTGGSIDLLTPPLPPPKPEKPPYKSRRGSSESLTMVRRINKSHTVLDDRARRRKRRHQRHHQCLHKKFKGQQDQHWWLQSACPVAPTAPSGQTQLCEGYAGGYTPKRTKHGTIDTFGRLARELRSAPAPVFTRRWSSVEMGSHQVSLESTLPPRSNLPQPMPSSASVDEFLPKIIGQRYRSSTFTRGAIDHDIVRIVVEKLTSRKLPHEQLTHPSSITLRRATESRASGGSNGVYGTGGSTPLAGIATRTPTYLITADDIDSIAGLLTANLNSNHQKSSDHPFSATRLPQQNMPSSGIINNGREAPSAFSTEFGAKVSQPQPSGIPLPSPDFLRVQSHGERGVLPRTPSQKSDHEVIWEPDGSAISGSPGCTPSVKDEDISGRRSSWDSTSEPPTPAAIILETPPGDKGNAFDPLNANASINEWSSRLPQTDIEVVVTSSDSDSHESPEYPVRATRHSLAAARPATKAPSRARARPSLRNVFSETELQDVTSFPPLSPRKKTIDWYSPLPPIETSSPLSITRSLYDIGLDVTLGPGGSKTVTPKSSQTSWVRSAESTPPRSIEFNPRYSIRCKSPEPLAGGQTQQNTMANAHNITAARTVESSTAGPSLDVNSGVGIPSACSCNPPAVSPLVDVGSDEKPNLSQMRRRLKKTAKTEPDTTGGAGESSAGPTVDVDYGKRRSGSACSSPQPCSPLPSESPAVRSLVDASFENSLQVRRSKSPRPGFFRNMSRGYLSLAERRSFSRLEPQIPSPTHETIAEGSAEISPREERRRSSLASPQPQHVRTIDNVHKVEHDPPTHWRPPTPFPSKIPRSPTPDSRPMSPEPAPATLAQRVLVDRLALLRARTPPLPAIDRVGIYGSITGGEGMARDCPCGSHKNERHVCDDCAKDPRTPSIDWIG